MELPARTLSDADLDAVLLLDPAAPPARALRRAAPPEPAPRPAWLDFWDLTKPEISFLVTLSALAGFLLGSPGEADGWRLCWTLAGTALSAAGGGVLNHYLERGFDARMRRTANRPLPSGRIRAPHALGFGVLLCAAGVAVLAALVGTLTTVLAALTIGLYLFVYTPLKRKTVLNTVVGTVPGALPALGGYAAATGTLGAGGWILFLILAFWQMPHFLSLAWMYRKDYARAGYAMLPVAEPDGGSTVRQTLLFTLLLAGVSIVPSLLGLTGWVYGAGALVLGLWFLVPAYAFYRTRTVREARRVLIASILYIPLLVVLIFVDRLI